jgi:hypothetical protein
MLIDGPKYEAKIRKSICPWILLVREIIYFVINAPAEKGLDFTQESDMLIYA